MYNKKSFKQCSSIQFSFVNLHGAIQLSLENLGVEKVSDKIFVRLQFELGSTFLLFQQKE